MSPVERVVVVVFDALRPDMVTAERMPNLHRFKDRGTWFREARSVFPSMTRVATASIATGAPPAVHGIVGNAFYFPEAIPEHVLDVSNIVDVRRGEAATGGRFVTAPTFADALAAAGKRVAIVHAGSSGSAYVLNPRARANSHWTFSVHGANATETPEAVAEVTDRFGPLPPRTLPRLEETDYVADVFTSHVLPNPTNAVSLVWFNEPDTTFHYKLLGSTDALAVLMHVDAAFGRIVDWVDRQPNSDRIAVVVASDHGQISSRGLIELPELLTAAGHATKRPAVRELSGCAVTFTGGNMGEIRVLDGGVDRRDALARWLAEQPYIGALFSRPRNAIEGQAPGSFASSLVGVDHARQPDLVYVMRSDQSLDPFGHPGLCFLSGGGVPHGGGMHGGLNRFEMNTTLMLAAPGVSRGVVEHGPAGIVDLAPTILALLGVTPPATMTGTSLLQPLPQTSTEAHETGTGAFRHSITLHRNGRRAILDHGHHH